MLTTTYDQKTSQKTNILFPVPALVVWLFKLDKGITSLLHFKTKSVWYFLILMCFTLWCDWINRSNIFCYKDIRSKFNLKTRTVGRKVSPKCDKIVKGNKGVLFLWRLQTISNLIMLFRYAFSAFYIYPQCHAGNRIIFIWYKSYLVYLYIFIEIERYWPKTALQLA